MPADPAVAPLTFTACALALLGAIALLAALVALRRRRPVRTALCALAGLLGLALGAATLLLALGIQGYRALTYEELAAQLRVQPLGAQRFRATFRFADGRIASYTIAGDEIDVDAHILKWHPWANLLGLHTSYELDRVSGRYRDIDQERTATRTVYPLALERPVDLFAWRVRHALLAPLLDADYGSATFVPVDHPTDLELRVSTTGLLIRPAPPP